MAAKCGARDRIGTVLASPVGQRSREQLLPGTFHLPGAGLTTATTGTGNRPEAAGCDAARTVTRRIDRSGLTTRRERRPSATHAARAPVSYTHLRAHETV